MQGWHTTLEVLKQAVTTYWPEAHTSQVVTTPFTTYWPGITHTVSLEELQATAAVAPEPHTVHACGGYAPPKHRNPGGHAMVALANTEKYMPFATEGTHALAPAREVLLPAQTAQALRPDEIEKVPAEHMVHAVLLPTP